MILGIIFTRRLMAAVGLEDGVITFMDSRFVPSKAAEIGRVSSSYLRRILDQGRPGAVFVCLPPRLGRISAALRDMLDAEAGAMGIPVKRLGRIKVLTSFGLMPLRNRRDVLEVASQLWPSLLEAKRGRQAFLCEAATVAAVGDVHQQWPPA